MSVARRGVMGLATTAVLLAAAPVGALADGSSVVVGARVGSETNVLVLTDGTVLRPQSSESVRITRERVGDTLVITVI
jgi:hypothetical protein